ncbi:unnamed protein product, partial [marine sediment metagenome]
MKRLALILLLLAGCAAPIVVHVPPRVIVREHPDARGVLCLRIGKQ